MARQMPYEHGGRDYVCALDAEVIPDGATVLGAYDEDDALTGVRVEDADGHVLHQCGQPVRGHELTPAERVEARAEPDYAAETGA